jgi:hypothetical protein
MEMYREVEVELHLFLISALDGNEWSASQFGPFTPGKTNLYTFGRMSLKVGLDAVEKRIIPSLNRNVTLTFCS